MKLEAYDDAAYFAALMLYLVETKADEADREIVQLLKEHSFYRQIVFEVLEAVRLPSA